MLLRATGSPGTNDVSVQGTMGPLQLGYEFKVPNCSGTQRTQHHMQSIRGTGQREMHDKYPLAQSF